MQNGFPQTDRQSALITEGTQGIGRVIARELVKTHAVIATTRGDCEAGNLNDNTHAEIVRCDIALREDREALISDLRSRRRRIHLLVNCTGMAPCAGQDLLEASEESFDSLLHANVVGPHFLSQALACWMSEQGGGRIVFMTFVPGYEARINLSNHCISTAGLSMSRALYAGRLAAKGIHVFEVRAGDMPSDVVASAELGSEEQSSDDPLCLRRGPTPTDVAKAVGAIANGELDFLTGQVLHINARSRLPHL